MKGDTRRLDYGSYCYRDWGTLTRYIDNWAPRVCNASTCLKGRLLCENHAFIPTAPVKSDRKDAGWCQPIPSNGS